MFLYVIGKVLVELYENGFIYIREEDENAPLEEVIPFLEELLKGQKAAYEIVPLSKREGMVYYVVLQ